MIRRTSGFWVALILICGSAARAQDATPAVTVWTSSLDGFLAQSRTLFDQLGLADAAGKFDQAVTGKLGVKRFAGIDGSRPLGAFLQFDPDPSGALLIPIAGEREFLDLLERLDVKAVKEADGTYRLGVPLPIPTYLKMSGKHAWITLLNKTAFAAKIDASRVFLPQMKLLASRVRIDLIPKDARQLVISHIEDALQDSFKKNAATSTPAQKAFVEACNQAIARQIAQLLDEGKDLTLDVTFDAPAKSLAASLTLSPKPGTPLAKTLAHAATLSTVFGKADGDPFAASVNAALPKAVAQAFSGLVEESFKEARDGLQDPAKKKQVEALLAAVMPSLKSGEIDAIVRFVGPSAGQKLGVIAGVKIAEGERVGALFKSMAVDARALMTDAEKAKVLLDADSAGPTKIHRFVLSADQAALRQAHNILGEAILSLAFRPDALVVGVGDGSAATIKRFAEPSSPATAPIARITLDIQQLSPLFAPTPKLKAAADDILRAPGDGLCQLEIAGGQDLTMRLRVRTPALRFMGVSRGERAAGAKE